MTEHPERLDIQIRKARSRRTCLGDWYPGRALAGLIGVVLVGVTARLNSRS